MVKIIRSLKRAHGTGPLEAVALQGGLIVDVALLARILAIEQRGATFRVDGDALVIEPDVLFVGDLTELSRRLPEAIAIVTYRAEDAHL